ncbi:MULTISPECIES: hypothetical protein [Legionella]|uniref:Uncharacterized protein n=1 Tax=Legionella maceachernii TaxID=466 RepID=A0A0W0W0S8_9GAMM|nr:hypothetical protein [Legionella maceachernii]KTD25837.1 hypothetical protein Lmac_1608 [Legionella maceachernii]SJZ46623.1 hypothetical protein SAMN02745128_00112 [Legionella maceachernii]SUP03981.1 Uncharacterised protein [Legionella maceachernii]
MSNQLKSILLKIAHLSKADQRWIISQLSTAEKALFIRQKGEELLQHAQHFRKLRGAIASFIPIDSLPGQLCKRLSTHSPLYIAIILEQGQYDWHEDFLRRFDHEGTIKHLLKTQVKRLKSSPKQALFSHWENTSSLSFDHSVENSHG